MHQQEAGLTELSALVGVFALVTSVIYSGDAYDLWDSMIGLVSGMFGALYLRSLVSFRRGWPISYVMFAGFLVATLMLGGAVTFLFGLIGTRGIVWGWYGPIVLTFAGLVVSTWLYWRNSQLDASTVVCSTQPVASLNTTSKHLPTAKSKEAPDPKQGEKRSETDER